MLMQVTDTILMIRPASFGYNSETAVNNFFNPEQVKNRKNCKKLRLKEFDGMVQALKNNQIEVLIVNDTPEPPKPDAIFPNNWLATSPEGIVSVFPLFAQSRRAEKRDDILKMLAEKFIVKDLHDWTEYEPEEIPGRNRQYGDGL